MKRERNILIAAGMSLVLVGLLAFGSVGTASAAPMYWSGPGTWDDGATSNWGAAPGGPYASPWAGGSDAHFEGDANTVTVDAAGIASVNAITFDVDGYTIGGGTITLTGAGGVITTGAGTDIIISTIAGAVGLTKTGAGTLFLGTAGAYTGTTNVNDGALQLSTGNDLASSTVIVVDGLNSAIKGRDSLDLGASRDDFFLGTDSTPHSLTIQSGGSLNNIRAMYIGTTATSNGNTVLVTDPNSNITNDRFKFSGAVNGGSDNFWVGQAGSNNIVTIANGAAVTIIKGNGANSNVIGKDVGADNNQLIITGAGSSFYGTAPMDVGSGGSGNSMTVSAGGYWKAQRLAIGINGSNNSVLVTGAGSYAYMTPSSNTVFTVGLNAGSSGNSLTVADGGEASFTSTRDNRLFAIGASDGADNNVVTVTGAGSALNLSHTKLAISLGGRVSGAANVVTDSTASGNHLDISSGASAALTPVYLLGVGSAINLGDGTGISTARMEAGHVNTVPGISLMKADSRLNINSGRLDANTGGLLVSGPGEVDLLGAASVATELANTISSVIGGIGSLTKEGGGTLTLSAANTYAGDTTVYGGTLSLANSYLADGSGVVIAGGAVIDLTHSDIDEIAALTVGGVAKFGTFAGGSDTWITGTGSLYVVPEPATLGLLALGATAVFRRRRRA